MDAAAPAKAKDAYRNYAEPARDTVREFYRQNHTHQTHDFVVAKKADFLRFNRRDDDALGRARLPQHAGRRLRPRHRAAADRPPAADRRGDARATATPTGWC